jgi:hypothetical protein
VLHLRGLLDLGLANVAERITGGGGKPAGPPLQGGREESVWRSWASSPRLVDRELEAHIEHAVGLVEDQDAHLIPADCAALHQALEAAGVATMMCALAALVAWAWMPTPL